MSKPWWEEEDDWGRPKHASKSSKGYNKTVISFGHAGSCYESHKPLPIGDTGLRIYGGSCSNPVVKDADIYIGFDRSMRFRHTLPWAHRQEIIYEIDDMQAPKEVTNFRKLVEWTAEQLQAGKKVHCGCIGGHGRTGTFLCALVTHMTGITDSVAYVRKNYCHKAVESSSQINYLHEHFGVEKASGFKQFISSSSSHSSAVQGSSQGSKGGKKRVQNTFNPVGDGNSIWGSRCS